jgi:N-acetyl sugar amidotransferase
MRYCVSCLQPDTRPNIKFTVDGQCPACAYAHGNVLTDWNERFEILENLISQYRRKGDCGFDCIIGVSGGKDSTRQALWVRDKLKMNPLLVCLGHPPQQTTMLGVDNVSNLINLGFDMLFSALAPETWRLLLRDSFFRFSNWARSAELALFSSVPQIAIRYGIPLIFWGENPALQVGDLNTMGRNEYDGNSLRNSNTLCSGHDWMLDEGYPEKFILPYIYPTEAEFENSNIQIVYLGWFLDDWSLVNNGMFSCAHGLGIRAESPDQTGDLLGLSNLDEDWHNMNQMIKYFKFGFGKVTEYVNESMRAGVMDRETAIDLVERFDGKCSPRYIRSFCDFIGISESSFWDHVHASTNSELFQIGADGAIRRRFRVGEGL